MKSILISSVTVAILLASMPSVSDAQWIKANGLPPGPVECLASCDSTLFAGGYSAYRSTDGGLNWVEIANGLPIGIGSLVIFTFASMVAIRYKAYLAELVYDTPSLFSGEMGTMYAEDEDLFNAISVRAQGALLGDNTDNPAGR